jgi:hypothetical protein
MNDETEKHPATETHERGQNFKCAGEPLTEKEMNEGLRHQAEYLDQLKDEQE